MIMLVHVYMRSLARVAAEIRACVAHVLRLVSALWQVRTAHTEVN